MCVGSGNPPNWLSNPKTEPDGVTPTAAVGTGRFYFFGNGANQLQATDLVVPGVGQWVLETLSFTPTGTSLGQSIGIELFVDSTPVGGGSGNDRKINFDIAPATVTPEPSSLLLAFSGLGLSGLALIRRRRQATV